MKTFSAAEICKILNGKLVWGSPDLIAKTGVYHIEKINKRNTLIFLRITREIKWEYIKDNLPCIIITDKILQPLMEIQNCSVILVDNIEIAFWAFVYYYRKLFNIPVAAVTGTCGKSTTKDMIIHMLKHKMKVTGTKASANSRTHHFDYMLGINDSTNAAVFETPVGKPGDIINSCKYFKPTIGVITNISMDHLSGCKTMDNYIKAKGEMLNCIDLSGVLVINEDDENIKKLPINSFKGRVVRFGLTENSNFQASNISFAEDGMVFTLIALGKRYNAFVPGYGQHQVYNALAALAVVNEIGIDMKEAIEFLKTFKNLPLHLQIDPGINGSIIMNDCWNTNPSSLEAAVQVLDGISKGRKRYLVIGDINALGDSTLEAHLQVGEMLANTNCVDVLITIGEFTAEAANRALERGFKGEVYKYPNAEGVLEFVKSRLDSNSILLIKSAGYHDFSILNISKKLKTNIH